MSPVFTIAIAQIFDQHFPDIKCHSPECINISGLIVSNNAPNIWTMAAQDLEQAQNKWSNFIWMHIGLTICHFLLSVVSITGGPKNKILRKSGIHSSVPCWNSTLEQFLFYRVSGKNAKSNIIKSHSYSEIHLSKQRFCHKREDPRNIMFFNFLDTQ